MSGISQSIHSRIKSLNIGEILSLAADNKKIPKSFKITQKIDKPRHISPDLSTNTKNTIPSNLNSPNRILTTTLRNRKKSPTLQITPSLAIEVVKDYIIPLFKQDKQKAQEKLRSETFNTKRSPTNIKSEFLLSEQIFEEKTVLEQKFQSLEKILKETTQDKLGIEREFQNLNEKYLNLEAEYKLLEYNFRMKQSYFNSIEQKTGFLFSQAEKLKKILRSTEDEKDELSVVINEEKYINDIRLYFIVFFNF